MGKSVSTDQSHAIMAALATNVDWSALDGDLLQEAVVRNPRRAGAEFTAFLKDGARMHTGQQVFLFTVNYDLTVGEAVELGEYDGVNSDITQENFPTEKKGQATVEIALVHFGRDISTKGVLEEFDKRGLRPADDRVLLAFGAKYPEVQREFLVVSLGSFLEDSDGCRFYPYLYRDGLERRLYLDWDGLGWCAFCRFVAVRK